MSDRRFLTDVLMSRFRIRRLILSTSKSKKRWPDIWVEPGSLPKITVTREWARQSTHERRKRLTHEIAGHLAFSWSHNPYFEKIGFSTYPDRDTMSWLIYWDLLKGKIKSPYSYIREKERSG